MVDNLNSIIGEIKDGKRTVGDFKFHLQSKAIEELTVDKNTFLFVLQCKAIKRAIVHEILLHFIQNLDNMRSLKDVIEHLEAAIKSRMYAKNNPIKNRDEELRAHMNFKNERGNTLLHQAVISNNTEAIRALFNYDINPLILNVSDKTPLNLAQGEKAKQALVEGMRNQAYLKKESARCNALFSIIPGAFLGVGLGIGGALAAPSVAIMLGTIAVSTFVIGMAVGFAIYFLSQDYKQAKVVENAINPNYGLASKERRRNRGLFRLHGIRNQDRKNMNEEICW